MKAASLLRTWEFMLAVVLVLELIVLGLINQIGRASCRERV